MYVTGSFNLYLKKKKKKTSTSSMKAEIFLKGFWEEKKPKDAHSRKPQGLSWLILWKHVRNMG